MKKAILLLMVLIAFTHLSAQTSIISYGSNWKYLDNGTNQGTTWRAAAFNDAAWTGGNAQLGYGDGDEATVVNYGTSASNKYVTTYFRKTISITNKSQYSAFSLSVKRDDGIVIYVNGTEVYRNNMPTGTVSYTTLASTAASDDGATAQTASLSVSAFAEGNNTIAVEVHQNSRTSSDLSFDLQLTGTLAPVSTAIVPWSAAWKYLDNGTNQGTAWRTAAFSDAAWASGNAQLGYGDGDEATVVSYGANATSKYTTTYFRKTISITNSAQYASYALSVKRDDGIVLYVNGVEVYRNNMPTGTVTYTTLASAAASDDGATAQTATIPASVFINGNNTIAAEIHQNAGSSTDISFDLQITGNSSTPQTASLTRGPYLQMGNQTAVTLRWRTDIGTNTRLEAGTAYGTYAIAANDAAVVTEHEIRITGLSPDTKYYYRFGSSTQVLQSGTDNFFITSPPATTKRKIRVAAFGDCGRNDNSYQPTTLTAYNNYVGANPAEVLLLLGDNAYNNGTDAEFQSNYFNVYSSSILKNHQLFPSPGNHDYANTAARQADHNIPYNSIFSTPSAAQCGGVASGTEAYYSWDWGNIHFLSLDSYGLENSGTTRLYDTAGAQAVWVKQDLSANTKPWVIAYWHHPPFSMGSNNGDTQAEMINIRQNFIRILERLGVDLIVCGHSHDYERSYLLKGYYGNEASFNPATHTLSTSSAKYDGSASSCPYATVNGANHGTVYVVAGSAGASGGTQTGYPHNAMPYSVNDGGTFYFEIEDNRLDAKFIRRTGVVWDNFTILKNINKTNTVISSPGATVQLTASWPGTYSWSTGETARTISVSPSVNTTYTVRDAASATCVTDVFNVNVTGGLRTMNTVLVENSTTDKSLKIAPTFVQRGQTIQVITNENKVSEITIIDVHGRIIQTERFSNRLMIQTSRLQSGIYFLKLKGKAGAYPRQFVVMD